MHRASTGSCMRRDYTRELSLEISFNQIYIYISCFQRTWSLNAAHFISAFIPLCPIVNVILFHLCLVISVKTVGIAKVTTIMGRESTKPKSIAIPNIIRVVQRVLPGGEVRCRHCTLLLFGQQWICYCFRFMKI